MKAGPIQVFRRSVYGRVVIYPFSASADVLAALVGKKTLDERDLANAQKLGLQVDFMMDPELSLGLVKPA